MLEIRSVDLVALAEALEDRTAEHTWWFDPQSGQLELGVDGVDPGDLDTDRLIPVDPLPYGVIRRDVQEFLDGVQDSDALVRLGRAAESGEIRKFVEAVAGFPELRLRWREFVDERRQRRAVQWLADEGVVPAAQVDRELAHRRALAAGRTQPPALDPDATAAEALALLGTIYGSRLRRVVPMGDSPAVPGRPPAIAAAGVRAADLLVVLDRLDSVWTELARMEPALWRLGSSRQAVVTAIAVGEDDLRSFRPVRAAAGGDSADVAPADVSDELAAAHALVAAGLPRPAVAHAVAAALLAAAGAAGPARPGGDDCSPAALVAALASARRGQPPAARLLRSLVERARAAAQPGAVVPPGEAARAVADAQAIVRSLGWPSARSTRPA